MRTILYTVALWLFAARAAYPCSAFLHPGDDGPVVAKSYDWSQERALVLINKRNVNKRALALSFPLASWTSRHASVTFNQYGREFPNGGMNERGLVVEVLMLPASTFPSFDTRPAVSELGLVQYLLDQAATLPEAVALASEVRVVPVHAKLHYFVCDRSGACATLEYLDGALVTTQGNSLPVAAITNSTYAESRRSLAARGKVRPRSSLGRFHVLADALAEAPAKAPVQKAWTLLDQVRFTQSTQWQIVYEPTRGLVHFRSRTRPDVKTVSLRAFDPGCSAPVMVYDLLARGGGDVTAKFVPYQEKHNRALIASTFKPLRHVMLGDRLVPWIAAHPGTLTCGE